MADLIGKTLGNYRIEEQIGQGGMATVYKAHQPVLERYVAIKIIHEHLVAQDEQLSKRFQREAQAAASLRHPGIVQVFDFGIEDNLAYIVMEYLSGNSLKIELKRLNEKGETMPLVEAQRIFQAVANAVDYAHSQGIFHRDLKPDNIVLTTKRDVILTDFGLSKIVGGTQYTGAGAVIGTPAYMSPEQGQGKGGDARSDIYSLGVMLYEMVTGRVPFETDTLFGMILKHINDPVPPPRELNPALPEKVEQVILKALAKNPDDRYQTAGEMARALTAAATAEAAPSAHAVPAPTATLPEPEPRPTAVSRPRPEGGRTIPIWGWILSGLIGLCMIAGLLGGSAALVEIIRRTLAPATAASVAGPAITTVLPPLTPHTETPSVPVEAPTARLVTEVSTVAASAIAIALPTLTPHAEASSVPIETPAVSSVTPVPTVQPEEHTLSPSESPEAGPRPALAIGPDGVLHLTWADTSGGGWNVYYTRSSDGGATFSAPVPVDTLATDVARGSPTLAVGADNHVYVAWEDGRSGNWDVYCTHSNGGITFSVPVRASDDDTQFDQVRPALAIGQDGRLHLAWQDGRDGDWRIYYAESLDSGASFGSSLPVDPQAQGQQTDPAIGVDSQGIVHLAWADDRSGKWAIYHTRSEGGGFDRGRVVGSGLMADLANNLPDLVIGPDDSVHIAWANAYVIHPNYNVPLFLPVYAVSTDRGAAFASPRQVGEGYRYVSVRQNETGLAVETATLHVVLTTYSPRDGGRVWYYRSTDGGQTFSGGVEVAQADGGDVHHYPVVAVDQTGRVHMAWAYQRSDEWDVYYAQSGDGGMTFSAGQLIIGR